MFKVGDRVKLEMRTSLVYPRWDFSTDHGASGTWVEGVIREVFLDSYRVKVEGKAYGWTFPKANCVLKAFNSCECGAVKTAADNKPGAAHSFWCPDSPYQS